MAVLVAGVNILWTAHDAILVLFAQERLGLGSVGFGLLLTGSVIGGVLGSVVAGTFGLPAPFVLAGVAIPVMALLALPFVNSRTVDQARAAVA